MSKPLVTLKYFAVRGRAEPIRLLLEELQIPYNDVQVQLKDWLQTKPTLKFKQLPVYEEKHPSGDESKTLVIPQSQAILRYLARKYDVYGKTESERIRCDIVEELAQDFIIEIGLLIWDKKFNELRDSFITNKLSPHLELCEKYLKENKNNAHWVGNGFTFADTLMWTYLEIVRAVSNETLKKFPALCEFKQKFENRPNIAAYLKSGRRPPTYTVSMASYCNTPETS